MVIGEALPRLRHCTELQVCSWLIFMHLISDHRSRHLALSCSANYNQMQTVIQLQSEDSFCTSCTKGESVWRQRGALKYLFVVFCGFAGRMRCAHPLVHTEAKHTEHNRPLQGVRISHGLPRARPCWSQCIATGNLTHHGSRGSSGIGSEPSPPGRSQHQTSFLKGNGAQTRHPATVSVNYGDFFPIIFMLRYVLNGRWISRGLGGPRQTREQAAPQSDVTGESVFCQWRLKDVLISWCLY